MRILIVEDDCDLCEAVILQLENEGYQADACHDGEDALYYIEQTSYDIILLDRMLPGMDGITILNTIRQKKIFTPVLMVTAMNAIGDRIGGLDSGADDYLVKPFAIGELLARIRALARRPLRIERTELLQLGSICLYPGKRLLKGQTQSITLSKRESELMEFFLRNSGQILSRSQILSHVWGPDTFVEDGNIDNYIHFLRRRLRALDADIAIKTIHSIGYRLEEVQ